LRYNLVNVMIDVLHDDLEPLRCWRVLMLLRFILFDFLIKICQL
jgi:hypothetical protein